MPRIEVRKRNSSDLDGSTAPLRFFLGLSFNVKTMYEMRAAQFDFLIRKNVFS